MAIQLDNIHFYQPPSLPKRPQTTTSAATWKPAPLSAPASARTAVAAQPLHHMLPPKPPAPSGPTAPAPGASAFQLPLVPEGASQLKETVTPHNVFDIELGKVYEAENTRSTDATGAETDCSYVAPYSIFPDPCQDLETRHAGTACLDQSRPDDGEQDTSRPQTAVCPCIPDSMGNAESTTTASIPRGRSLEGTDKVVDRPGTPAGTQLGSSGTLPDLMDNASGHPSDSESSTLSDGARRTDSSAGMHTSPLPPHSHGAEAADRVNRDAKSKRFEGSSVTRRHSGEVTAVHRQRASHPERLHSTSACAPSQGSGRIDDATSPKRDPSIAVVIPVHRQSSRLKSKASVRNPPDKDGNRHFGDRVNKMRNPAADDDSLDDGSVPAEGSEPGARGRPRKRRKCGPRLKKAAGDGTASVEKEIASSARAGWTRSPSNSGAAVGPGQSQEVFGRGILRIQPHGPQHAYLFTFLPDVVDSRAAVSSPRTPDGWSLRSGGSSTNPPGPQGPPSKIHGKRDRCKATAAPSNGSGGTCARWTPAEDRRLTDLKESGHSWPAIERRIPQRTPSSLRKRWYTLQDRRLPSRSRARKQKRRCREPTFKLPRAIPPPKTPTRPANDTAERIHDAARGEVVSGVRPQSSGERRGPATSRGGGRDGVRLEDSTSRCRTPPRPQAVTVRCPVCDGTVDTEASGLPPTEYTPTRAREQMEFCGRHRRVAARREWIARGYPSIAWDRLHDRLTPFHTHLRRILDPGCPSTYKTALQDELRKNNKRFIYKGPQHKAGYYGPKGEEMLLDHVTDHFANRIQSMATTDALVLNYGVLTYAQEVLVPELLVLLVQEDMGVDNARAREILEESEEIGELINGT